MILKYGEELLLQSVGSRIVILLMAVQKAGDNVNKAVG
jgi:hypothetical protein